MIAILFLIGSFIMGAGVCRKLFPELLISPVEKGLWGMVTGTLLSVWGAYIICRIAGNIYFPVLTVFTLVIWLITGKLFYNDLRSLPKLNLTNLNIFREEGKYPLLLLIIFSPVYAYFFWNGMFHQYENGLYLTGTSWYDMALHLAIATSFLYGKNFPPMYTVLPAEPLHYPFLPDFHISILMNLGLGIWPAFAITEFITAITLTGIFYYFVKHLVDSKGASFIATLLFFLNGGLGFLYFFEQWHQSKKQFFDFLPTLPNNYTDMWSDGIKWTNLITSGLIPQRAMLYGMPVALIILSLFAITWRRWTELEEEPRWDGARLLVIAGILTGLLPLVHTHSYMMAGMISIMFFLVKPRYSWIAYWFPAVLLAMPQLINTGGHISSGSFLHFQPGWMSYLEQDRTLFMVRNFGFPLIMIFPALYSAPKYLRTFYIPFAGLFVFCFLFIISPNDYDNLKLMYYWFAVTAVVIGLWLHELATLHRQRFLVVFIVLCSTSSAILSIYRESRLINRVFSYSQVEAGNFARDNFPAKAMFLTGQYSNQPMLCFSGKPLVLGYEFWILSHGYSKDYVDSIKNDVKQMYEARGSISALLEKYKVDYIYISYLEKSDLKANIPYFDQHYGVAFKNKDITIYDAHKFIN